MSNPLCVDSLLVDGFNMAFRSYYAVPELNNSKGFPTNALHGWVRSLEYLRDYYKPERLFVFFDQGGSKRRLAIHPEYKAQRGEAPDDFKLQVPVMKELATAMGFKVIVRDGIEADDVLASFARAIQKKASDVSKKILMVSADKDLAQVVDEQIYQLCPPPTANPKLGWRVMDPKAIEKKFGVSCERVVDYLSLIGDASDNIPGIKGVGPKTAVKWLDTYGSLDAIIENYLFIKPPRFQPLIDHAREQLLLNKELIQMETDLPVGGDLDESFSMNLSELYDLLEEYELKTHLVKMQEKYG